MKNNVFELGIKGSIGSKADDDGGDGMNLESRVAKVEANVEHINVTLTDIKQDIRELRVDLKDLKKGADTNFRWVIGTFIVSYILGTAATIVTILLK